MHLNPKSFDGVDVGDALAKDGNQEIWVYQLPAVTDVDLSTGANFASTGFEHWKLFSNN